MPNKLKQKLNKKAMNITEDKLKGAIQIALGTLGLYTEEAETLLIHHIKALTIPVVSKLFICGCGNPKVEHNCQNCKGEIKHS